jgi:hypothetical protein
MRAVVQVSPPTSTDLSAKLGWRIEDAVIRLREWGSERVYGLPDTPTELTVGSASTCGLQLRDSSTQISREHAKLKPYAGGWKIVDTNSKNGLWRDGARRLEFTLTPGLVIRIGSMRLVAESWGLIALRELVCRFLGWSAQRQDDVDEALWSLREWAALRVSLVLMGDADLTPVARQLHLATLGQELPFVASDEHESGMAALQAAKHGTLWAPDLPPDFPAVAECLREVDNRTRLMLHARSADDAAKAAIALARPAIIALPSLSSRQAEIGRLINECAEDAAASLGAPSTGFTMNDLKVLPRLRYQGIADLEFTVRRVVAMRTWGVSNGALRLGIKHVSLSEWARRRKLST